MNNAILEFWSLSFLAGVVALLLLRRWPFLALFVLPLTVAVPVALASAASLRDPSFPGFGSGHVIGACLLVAVLNIAGMQRGRFKVFHFGLYPGRGPSSSESEPPDRTDPCA